MSYHSGRIDEEDPYGANKLKLEFGEDNADKGQSGYVTKDSGVRAQFDSGMVRDTEDGKPRFDLTMPLDIPFEEQMWTRFAELMARGAEKYTERNWEQANSESELKRYLSSALRHFMQWYHGDTSEDHASAIFFNVTAAEAVKYKMSQGVEESVNEKTYEDFFKDIDAEPVSKQSNLVPYENCPYRKGGHQGKVCFQEGDSCYKCGWTLYGTEKESD